MQETIKCSVQGCTNITTASDEPPFLCEKHERQATDSEDGEFRYVSETELLRFLLVDTEIRSLIKDQKLIENEQYRDDKEYEDRKFKRSQLSAYYAAERRQKEKEQRDFVGVVSERFGIPTDKIAFDDKTGLVRDLRDL